MLPVIVALGLVAGIVGLAANQADDPSIRRFMQRRRLLAIASKPEALVTLAEAEDALAISRYLGESKLHKRFVKVVASKKQPRRSHP